MASETSFWYRVGHAIESARLSTSQIGRKLPGLGDRTRAAPARSTALVDAKGGAEAVEDAREDASPFDDLVWTAVAALAARMLDAWRPSRRAGVGGLLKAGAAGAAAALVLELLKPLLSNGRELPALDRDTGERILAGVGQGLLYGAVVEPRVPGPALVKGALFGSAEYAANPTGGLAALLGQHAPLARVPLVSDLFEGLERQERVYAEHLVFGVTLALLYGSSRSSNGIVVDEVEDEAE